MKWTKTLEEMFSYLCDVENKSYDSWAQVLKWVVTREMEGKKVGIHGVIWICSESPDEGDYMLFNSLSFSEPYKKLTPRNVDGMAYCNFALDEDNDVLRVSFGTGDGVNDELLIDIL